MHLGWDTRRTTRVHFALLIRAVIKFVATLTWIVTGGDKDLFVPKPGHHRDVLADDGRHMTTHDGHVLADCKLVVHLHPVRLLDHFKVGSEGGEKGKKTR